MIRVAITGPESTGKSSLASSLAEHFDTIWVKEFARSYLEVLDRPYTIADLIHISYSQQCLIDGASEAASKLYFADTEMLVMKVWSEVVFRRIPEDIETLLNNQEFDIYLLCDTDLPWQPDPLREHPDRRKEIFSLYEQELKERKLPYFIVRGSGLERIEKVKSFLSDRFNF